MRERVQSGRRKAVDGRLFFPFLFFPFLPLFLFLLPLLPIPFSFVFYLSLLSLSVFSFCFPIRGGGTVNNETTTPNIEDWRRRGERRGMVDGDIGALVGPTRWQSPKVPAPRLASSEGNSKRRRGGRQSRRTLLPRPVSDRTRTGFEGAAIHCCCVFPITLISTPILSRLASKMRYLAAACLAAKYQLCPCSVQYSTGTWRRSLARLPVAQLEISVLGLAFGRMYGRTDVETFHDAQIILNIGRPAQLRQAAPAATPRSTVPRAKACVGAQTCCAAPSPAVPRQHRTYGYCLGSTPALEQLKKGNKKQKHMKPRKNPEKYQVEIKKKRLRLGNSQANAQVVAPGVVLFSFFCRLLRLPLHNHFFSSPDASCIPKRRL